MEDRLFHLVDIAIQVLGLGFLVFKGGRYIGEATGMFKTLFKTQDEIKDAQQRHQEDDDHKHEKIMNSITEVKVAIAGVGKK